MKDCPGYMGPNKPIKEEKKKYFIVTVSKDKENHETYLVKEKSLKKLISKLPEKGIFFYKRIDKKTYKQYKTFPVVGTKWQYL